MPQELLNIIYSVISIILTGLASWAVTMLIKFLSSKIKDKELSQFLIDITMIITDAVKQVYQEFVEVLKENGKFDAKAQAEAKKRAMDIIDSQLTTEMKEYIQSNYGNIEAWISHKIEAIIYNLKNMTK